MAIGLVYLASSRCQLCDREGPSCSMSAGTTAHWIKSPFDGRRSCDFSNISFRCRNTFGSVQSSWLGIGDETSLLSKVRVAADYSDSAPDSTKYSRDRGYHPLEELKERRVSKDLSLTDAEVARTLVEANCKALLVFPGMVHYEPHEHASWSEFQYVVDDYGDIFFQLHEDENVLEDHGANNPVTVFIGMDSPPMYGDISAEFNDDTDDDNTADISLDDDYDEVGPAGVTDILIEWGMPATLRHIHPLYFSKCLIKAVHANYGKKMDWPSNGLSVVGYLRPAFLEEESYLRGLFHRGDEDGYLSDWRDNADESVKELGQVAGTYGFFDSETSRFSIKDDGSKVSCTIYKLEIMSMELFSLYGNQSMIDLQDFQDAEPDILARSASAIIERINDYGTECNAALRTLSRKRKGLTVQGAKLIGVDSLGIDVRVFCGIEAQTLRFSFNARAMSESAAEKKIKRMIFPRYYRKNQRISDGFRDL